MAEQFVDPGEDRSDLLTPVYGTGPQAGDRQNFLRQFPKNLGSNIVLFLVNVGVGIWLIPYFIHNLGVAAYGLIYLVLVEDVDQGYLEELVKKAKAMIERKIRTLDLTAHEYSKLEEKV